MAHFSILTTKIALMLHFLWRFWCIEQMTIVNVALY